MPELGLQIWTGNCPAGPSAWVVSRRSEWFGVRALLAGHAKGVLSILAIAHQFLADAEAASQQPMRPGFRRHSGRHCPFNCSPSAGYD